MPLITFIDYFTQLGELETAVDIRDKEITYLKRALESVYTRFMSRDEMREAAKEAEMDAELIANRTIERLTQRDEEIAALRKEIIELKAKLEVRPKTEKEFKVRSPPPPPPAPKPKRMATLPPVFISSTDSTDTSKSQPTQISSPPPPPPPPPPLSTSLLESTTSLPHSASPPPPPLCIRSGPLREQL